MSIIKKIVHLYQDENCCDQSEDLIQYLVNIDEDLENWHPKSLLKVVHEFHSQNIYHDSQEQLVEDVIN